MTVSQILKEKGSSVVTLGAKDTVQDAVRVLAEHQIGALLVTADDGAVSGVISERDIVRALAENGAGLLERPVSDLMTRDVHGCSPDDSISMVMELMTHRRIRHLPVLNDSHLVGIISIGDVVKHKIAEAETEARALRDYIATG